MFESVPPPAEQKPLTRLGPRIGCVDPVLVPPDEDQFGVRLTGVAFGVGLVVAVSLVEARAQTNLVASGSFEARPAGGRTIYLLGLAWPGCQLQQLRCCPIQQLSALGEQGNYSAYFRGHPTDSSQDCLGTTVNLRVGALYHISYYLGTDGSTFGTGAAMWVVIGTSFGIDLSQDILLTAFYANSSTHRDEFHGMPRLNEEFAGALWVRLRWFNASAFASANRRCGMGRQEGRTGCKDCRRD